jgi:ADP-heptose:LPS heptosyltransferase
MLAAAGIGADGPFVAVHAGSGPSILAMAKRWPTEKYAQLIGRLRREFDLPAVLLEGPDEAGVADEIIAAGAGAFGAVGLRLKGPLGGSAAVLERARLYVGSDSGLAHLAAAVGRRCVTIFSPADPDRVCPYGNRDLVVQPPPPCGPCFLYPFESPRPKMRCDDPMCIRKVEVETVMSAVRRALDGRTAAALSASGAAS